MGQCKHWVGTLCFVRNRTKGARPPTHAKLTSGGGGGANTAIVRGRHKVVGHFQVWSLMRHAKNLNYLSLR